MFNFKDLSNSETEEEKFDPEAFRLSFADFLEKRRTAARPYVFDLRTAEEYEYSHLTGAYSLPMYHFEDAIYQMPYEGDILLYGGENDEGRQAAEILYENGFDTFHFIEDYQGLLESLRHARYSITNHAMEGIRKRLQDSSLKGFRIVVKPISTKKQGTVSPSSVRKRILPGTPSLIAEILIFIWTRMRCCSWKVPLSTMTTLPKKDSRSPIRKEKCHH
jgi:rhodanese-related sulfurtransferase